MRQQANTKRRDIEFKEGDYVLVKLQPYRQHSVERRQFHKLSKRFFGPYKIIERFGAVAYKLDLPESSRIHPVFHVSLLRLWKGGVPSVINALPEDSFNDHPVLVPTAVLASRVILNNGEQERQILVQWKNSDPDDCSWEKFEDIKQLCSDSNLEDKVIFSGGGDDMNHIDGIFPIILNDVGKGKRSRKKAVECDFGKEEVEHAGRNGLDSEDRGTGLGRSARARREPGKLRDYVC